MSGRVEMSAPLQDNEPELTGSRGMKVALIGPNEMHRKIVAKAVGGSETRSVREFVDYPTDLADLPRILEQNYDVIMIDVDSDQSYALKLVETIASVTNAMVMVYSKRNDPELMMICMRAGARDFLPLPEEETPAAPAAATGPQLVSPDLRPVPSGPQRSFEPPPRPTESVAFVQAAPVHEPKIDDFGGSSASLAEIRQAAHLHSLQQDIDEWDQAHLRAPEPPPVVKNPAPIPQPVISSQPSILRAPEPVPQSMMAPPQSMVPASFPAQDLDAQSRSTTSADPSKTLTNFDEWDSAFLRSPQSSSVKNNGASLRASIAPAPEAPFPAVVRNPEVTPRPVPAADPLPKVEPVQASVPADTSALAQSRPKIDRASLPVFQYEVPEEEKTADSKWKIWVAIAAVVGAIACTAVVVFLHPFKHAAPVPQQTQVVEQQQPQAQTAWQPVDAASQPAPSPTPSKPSAATPAASVVNSNSETGTTSANASVSSEMMNAQLSAESRIPKDIKSEAANQQQQEQPPAGFSAVSMDNGGGNAPGAIFGGQPQVQVVAGVHTISSGVADGMLIHKVAPIYPKFAQENRISGTVVLRATITKSGSIEGLQLISGPKILSESALNAVKYWRYRPYLLNNQPVEVQTTINVVFNLNN
jgi:periplasmic protein TonB